MNDNETGELRRYVVITHEILGSKELNPNDKLLLAYISSFEQYYASNASTAEFLGLSERMVERSKQKLTNLGFIRIIKRTGRGNIYAFDMARLAKYGESDAPNMANQTSQIWRTENKVYIKENNTSAPSASETVEKSEEYGRKDINELARLWESETGISVIKDQKERRQLYNLIRKYGSEATIALIRRVGAMRRENDRFAPNIATPSQLNGKYGKLHQLEAWEQRQKQAAGGPIPTPPPAYARNRGSEQVDYAWEEISDEERAEGLRILAEARKRLGFTKEADDGE